MQLSLDRVDVYSSTGRAAYDYCTLGAKRHHPIRLLPDDGTLHAVISGIPRKSAPPSGYL
ncbi:hypothetical protein [Paenibacillus pabuli]|uniref:hypothetical protein n=1 Tax=Paenibacillus pabuli TaxID=1472 RepID=UPI003CF64BE7